MLGISPGLGCSNFAISLQLWLILPLKQPLQVTLQHVGMKIYLVQFLQNGKLELFALVNDPEDRSVPPTVPPSRWSNLPVSLVPAQASKIEIPLLLASTEACSDAAGYWAIDKLQLVIQKGVIAVSIQEFNVNVQFEVQLPMMGISNLTLSSRSKCREVVRERGEKKRGQR
jgi:hypothetical protein